MAGHRIWRYVVFSVPIHSISYIMRCSMCDRHIFRHAALSCDDPFCMEILCWGCFQKKTTQTICCEKMICEKCDMVEYEECIGCRAEICPSCQVPCSDCHFTACTSCEEWTMTTCCQCGETFCDTCLPQYWDTEVCDECVRKQNKK